jgi:hypothetical protein
MMHRAFYVCQRELQKEFWGEFWREVQGEFWREFQGEIK